MRCVIVNGARLKADAQCAHCGNQIGAGYIRDIVSRRVYCDYPCYSAAAEVSMPTLDRCPTQPLSVSTRNA